MDIEPLPYLKTMLTCLLMFERTLSSFLESWRLYHEHVFRLTVSMQSLRDAIEADDPKLFQMFQKAYSGQEKLTAQAMSALAQRTNEQLAPLQQAKELLQTIEAELRKIQKVN